VYAQHDVLFWVFIGFFIVLGIVALLTIVGVIKTDRKFRNFAVATFAVSIVTVVVLWAKTPSARPPDHFLILEPPSSVPQDRFMLVSGSYEYYPGSDKGEVELTVGQLAGSWIAKIPYVDGDRAVKLMLKDGAGAQWAVSPFYPKYSQRSLTSLTPVPSGAPEALASAESLTRGVTPAAAAVPGSVRINNFARPGSTVGARRIYQWRVFIDEPPAVLNTIQEVQYLLHPTFPEPFQVRRNPADRFALETTGWGSFEIDVTIRYRSGKVDKKRYTLDLGKSWPAGS
jgi:hypothetical protein